MPGSRRMILFPWSRMVGGILPPAKPGAASQSHILSGAG
jgi:hypothetical protein